MTATKTGRRTSPQPDQAASTESNDKLTLRLPSHTDDPELGDTALSPCRRQYRQVAWAHVKVITSVIAHVGFAGCLAVVVWWRRAIVAEGEAETARRLYRHYLIASSLAGFLYIVLMVEAAACDTYRALRRLSACVTFDDYVGGLISARPCLRWHAESYHYEVRSQASLQRDAKGQVNVRHFRRKERIVTRRESECFRFNSWRDLTPDLPRRLKAAVVRLEFSKIVVFKDAQSKEQYEKDYLGFRNRTRGKDTFTEYSEEFELLGYSERLLAFSRADRRGAPCVLRELWFWCATMVLLTWPYRWLFYSLVPRVQVVFVKEIGRAEQCSGDHCQR